MAKRTRQQLMSTFITGSVVTQEMFDDVFESLHHLEDKCRSSYYGTLYDGNIDAYIDSITEPGLYYVNLSTNLGSVICYLKVYANEYNSHIYQVLETYYEEDFRVLKRLKIDEHSEWTEWVDS